MKKIFLSIIILAVVLSISSCSTPAATIQAEQSTPTEVVPSQTVEPSETPQVTATSPATATEPDPAQTTDDPQASDAAPKVLIAFFSRAGENINVGFIEKGNTHVIAVIIAELTGAEMFKIETVTPYPESYSETTDIAKREQDENARPELSTHVENMDQYDIILLGYPNWWGTMPMAVFTFLEEYDFAGKTVIPFCTHEGSGLGRSERDLASLLPEVTLMDGLAIRGSNVNSDQARQSVSDWLREQSLIP
ncbi:MAG: flavodoxin [Anaerolineaceae bacterium]|nr:flavodoxin [Anaerolineaceae bacterium]